MACPRAQAAAARKTGANGTASAGETGHRTLSKAVQLTINDYAWVVVFCLRRS